MESEDTQTKYDVIVFGVTGFTGQFVAEELQRLSTSRGLKWAVAGRNKSKVQAVLNGMKIITRAAGTCTCVRSAKDWEPQLSKNVATQFGNQFKCWKTWLINLCVTD